ncbi:VOC family protein [Paenibacillus sp. NPDC058174]
MGRVVLFDLSSQDPDKTASFYSSVLVDPVGNGIGLIQYK